MKYKEFYSYLIESSDDDVHESFFEAYSEHLSNILEEFVSGKKHISWKRIPAGRLVKIWNDFGKLGFVRDEKGVLLFKRILLNNIVRLTVTTDLMGHSETDPDDMIEQAGYEDVINLEDDETEKRLYWEFLTDEQHGYAFLSDYGLKPLQKLFIKIYSENSPDKLVYLIDRALNVVHQRSDLADMFVEGGTSTLLAAGGYSSEN